MRRFDYVVERDGSLSVAGAGREESVIWGTVLNTAIKSTIKDYG